MKDRNELRSAIRGSLLLPNDNGFDSAARPWNTAIEQPVLAVAEPLDLDDLAALVRFARNSRLTLTVQPHGHAATGNCDGVILVRTKHFDQLHLNLDTRTARVGAGVSWGRLLEATAGLGLVGLAGPSPTNSIVGQVLGGGLSWFSRRYGWACESVIAFDIIDANGKQARIDADSDPDLFWALRGGGGDFALVTAVELELYPAPNLYGGRMIWPLDRAPEVLAAYREVIAGAPDELTAWWHLLRFPRLDTMVGVDVAYLGNSDEGSELLRRLDRVEGRVSDTRRPMPITSLGSISPEPPFPFPARHATTLLTQLDDVAEKALLDKAIDPLLTMQLRHLGGALARPSDSAAGTLSEEFSLHFFGQRTSPGRTALISTRIEEFRQDLCPYLGSRTPLSALAPEDTAADAFSLSDLTKLQEIKRHRDPNNVFRSNFPV